MAICGNCKREGVTVAHVHECYASAEFNKVNPPRFQKEPRDIKLIDAPESGIFTMQTTDGFDFYKVVRSQESGRYYAKLLTPETGKWSYAGQAPLFKLTQGDRITAEQAAKFGHLYGSCVFCSRTLTDERSITAGYGQTCAENHGLPWGHVDPVDAPMLVQVPDEVLEYGPRETEQDQLF